MSAIPVRLRRLVTSRAGNRCEYCGLRQEHAPFTPFHIEHAIARQHGGGDDLSNLALACHHCNLHKGPNLTGIDPRTREVVPLFHPRKDRWKEHFELDSAEIRGLTTRGRATVQVLNMNSEDRLVLRMELRKRGEC